MKAKIYLFVASLFVLIFTAPALCAGQADTIKSENQVLRRAISIHLGSVQRASHEHLISSAPLRTFLETSGKSVRKADIGGISLRQSLPVIKSLDHTQGCQNVFTKGGVKNIRVNQDCSLRRQAETVIAVNPLNSRNLIAGANDSRLGFNRCGYAWSFDSGNTWGDLIPPFYQFLMADDHTADACSDPTATFDAGGNAYIVGLLFDIVSPASALVVAKSNFPIGGAFYHSPNSTIPFQTYDTETLGVIANDNDPNVLNDKDFAIADSNPASPKKNNVYATWTRFNSATGNGTGYNSPIYFSQSTDGGATWSPGVEISGASPACTDFSGSANANQCDQDQGSDPIVGPDGTIYISFNNTNTPADGINQFLIVSCPETKDCSLAANWTAPIKIADDISKQPFGPSSATGCSPGDQCLPPNGYRVGDDTTGSLSVDKKGDLYFVWADFRNGVGGSCDWNNAADGQASSATPPCDNDVFFTFSTDGGINWNNPINVTPASKFGPSAQWQSWSAVAPDGSSLFLVYYDRSYGNCEFTGCNDITLATVKKPISISPKITYKRITTSSMPNLTPANNPLQAGFLGDYIWVTVNNGKPYVVWTDTRGLHGAVEEDIYFSK